MRWVCVQESHCCINHLLLVMQWDMTRLPGRNSLWCHLHSIGWDEMLLRLPGFQVGTYHSQPIFQHDDTARKLLQSYSLPVGNGNMEWDCMTENQYKITHKLSHGKTWWDQLAEKHCSLTHKLLVTGWDCQLEVENHYSITHTLK